MLRSPVVALLSLAAVVLLAAAAPGFAAPQTTAYAGRVTRICAGALLFEGRHTIGTRTGAVAVSRDIRETGTRRLRRVAAVPKPAAQLMAITRWLAIERRLVAAYARDYLLIWDAIEGANSSAQHAHLPARIHPLVHDADALKRRAGALELHLGVPDCTGGGS